MNSHNNFQSRWEMEHNLDLNSSRLSNTEMNVTAEDDFSDDQFFQFQLHSLPWVQNGPGQLPNSLNELPGYWSAAPNNSNSNTQEVQSQQSSIKSPHGDIKGKKRAQMAKRIDPEQWDQNLPFIRLVFVEKKLVEIKEFLRTEHNFNPT
jgi:hypothetical protein